MDKKLELIIEAKAKDIGDNFIVRRSLPQMKKQMLGPFIFWDHMGPVEIEAEREMKVRAHPHIGLATITYLFSGKILHRDSLGNEQYILPGEVNWMTAGKGIVHSERAKAKEGEGFRLEGIQLWVALPKEHEETEPSFVHVKADKIPRIKLGDMELSLIAGKIGETKSPVPVFSDLFYAAGEAKAGQELKLKLDAKQEAGIYVIEGSIELAGSSYGAGKMILQKLGEDLEFRANEDCKFMIFGGSPFPEKRHIWWNFVSTSKDRIESAKQDWRLSKFPKVINETEEIPLPE